MFRLVFLMLSCGVSALAQAETIRLGPYSGKPGYFAQVGPEFQLTLDAVVMNAEVDAKLRKLKFNKLGGTAECSVDGLQQAIGFTVFKIKSCK